MSEEHDVRKFSNALPSPLGKIGDGAVISDSWRRPPQERFYLGDDESDDDEDVGQTGWTGGVAMPRIAEARHQRHSSFDDRYQNDGDDEDNDSTESKPSDEEDDEDRHENCFRISSDEEDEDDCENIRKKLFKTNQHLAFEEDSGLGGSAPHSANEDEAADHATDLVCLRGFSSAKPSKKICSYHSRQSPKPVRKQLQFYDRYKMAKDHLGAGAYACVRTCVSLETGEEFAVKLVDKRKPGHTRSRIFREVEIFKLCKSHPNIVQLVEWFEDDVFFYMVFEKMRGGQLLDHIQRKVCFTEREAAQVTRDIAQALKHLHDRGIAHRDVKPENILCTDADRVSPVKLCDLDLASKPNVPGPNRPSHGRQPQDIRKRVNHFSDDSLPSDYSATTAPRNLLSVASEPDLASPVGSAEFMAPEVVDAFVGESLKYDKRCDMWSLGVIVYIMLCGYPPFYGECERNNCGWDQGQACSDCQESLFHRIQIGEFDFPEEEWAEISDDAKDLISHLLVRNVRQRYTADEVLRHSWLADGAPRTPLQTPSNLFRNDSARDMHQMNQVFQVYQHLSQPPF